MRVDLHMHSTASDGVYSPAEVVQIALTNQMDVVALTDHDNVAGLPEAWKAASGKLEVLAGVELSSEDETADRHIIGYLVDTENAALLALLKEMRDSRVHRADRIVQKLADLGLNVPLERVYQLAGTGSVGRPHIAKVMVEKGLVGSIQEAFDKYLEDNGPAYVPHYRLSPKEAIGLVHGAGGVAVLAHPGHYEQYHEIVDELVPLGLDGLEVYYYDHTAAVSEDLRVIARQKGLVMTVGSDFHRREPDGTARIGTVKVPESVDIVGPLKERAEQYRQPKQA